MALLGNIGEKLNAAQAVFCRAADAIGVAQWAQQPGPEQWSAAEVVAHLVVVERGILAKADSVTQKAPLPIPFSRRWHLPMWLVEKRVIRRKSPVPQDPSLFAEKEVMLGTLRCARERTLCFLAETESRDLSQYCWKHPFLGTLSVYGWMEMIAAHQLRHAKQVRDIQEEISQK